MNQGLRWMLILGCLMLAVLEAPRSSALVVEDLAGPYGEAPVVRGPTLARTEPAAPLPAAPGAAEALSLAETGTR